MHGSRHLFVSSVLVLPLVSCGVSLADERRMWEPVIVDFDGDGHPDIIVDAPGGYFLLRGGSFEERHLLVEKRERAGNAFAVGDVDGDGRPDLVYWGHGKRVVLGGDTAPFDEREVRFLGDCTALLLRSCVPTTLVVSSKAGASVVGRRPPLAQAISMATVDWMLRP
jgi:hypothetical protein